MKHGLNLDVPGGQAAASSIKGIVGDMRGIIGRIKASAAGGLSDWGGTAARTFDHTHTDWHATATRLEQALDDIEAKLTTGFRGYDDQDAAAGSAITQAAAGSLTLP
ncbi:MAG: WXG100 family type VII secretion target [Gordonia sp. (in: high G+C Gram-positive bacteria)]|uniref:WXG100 family type VII secretion target n=1 Tax=Gordonia sp. (in: high G+C Gram-positive bacteria) TaxID=84139 RepID=UPI0039E51AB1